MKRLFLALVLLAVPLTALVLAETPPATPPASDSAKPADWPDGVDWPTDMERYESVKFTQRVASTTAPPDHRGDFQERVPRTVLEPKYQVNGGMVGFKGITSELYRNKISRNAKAWVGMIDIYNGGFVTEIPSGRRVRRSTQELMVWKLNFPEDSRFRDVLRYKGKIFEARQREKVNGKWRYTVVYEDVAARPPGYTGKLTQSCQDCHRNAGGLYLNEDAEYGKGLPSGSDETFSVNPQELEYGR